MKVKEPRKPRSYKITDKDYLSALRRAKRDNVKFASMMEEIAVAYGDGATGVSFKIHIKSPKK